MKIYAYISQNQFTCDLVYSRLLMTSMRDPSVRKACWESRDRYWTCLDLTDLENRERCQELRRVFEDCCPGQWVSSNWQWMFNLVFVLSNYVQFGILWPALAQWWSD